MKVCSKCGASVAAENKFCTMCGCLVEEVSNETTPQAAPIQDNMAMNQMPVNNMVQNNGMANGYNSYNQAPQYNLARKKLVLFLPLLLHQKKLLLCSQTL